LVKEDKIEDDGIKKVSKKGSALFACFDSELTPVEPPQTHSDSSLSVVNKSSIHSSISYDYGDISYLSQVSPHVSIKSVVVDDKRFIFCSPIYYICLFVSII
jgi:hypothetical protein